MVARALIAAALIALPAAAQAALTYDIGDLGPGAQSTTFTVTGLNGGTSATLDGMFIQGVSAGGERPGGFSWGDYPYGTTGGSWTISWVGTNDSASGVAFDLGGDFKVAGAWMNGGGQAELVARDADFNEIEVQWADIASANLSGDNQGTFRGIISDSANIRYLELRRSFAIAHTIYAGQGVTAPVPEPGEWAMIVAGLGVVGAAARRRRRA